MKRIGVVSVIMATMLLCSCGEKQEAASVETTATPPPAAEENVPEEPPEEPVYLPVETELPAAEEANARIRTIDSEEYYDIFLKKGATVHAPSRQGYTFTGYQDKITDGVTYIDAEGTVTRDYYGTDLLILWPQFVANDYETTFYENGNRQNELPQCKLIYAKNIYQELHFGRVLSKSTDSKDEKDRAIIGYVDADGKDLISYSTPEITVSKFGDCVDYDARTITANIKTTPISYAEHINAGAESTWQINNDGFFKQEVTKDGKPYHEFNLSEQVDLDALRALGYKTADIHLECVMVAKDGVPHIRVLNCCPDDEKITDDMILLDSAQNKSAEKGETVKDKMTGSQETYQQDRNDEGKTEKEKEAEGAIPLDKLKDNLYVFYNTESPVVVGSLFKDSWTLQTIRIEITFNNPK